MKTKHAELRRVVRTSTNRLVRTFIDGVLFIGTPTELHKTLEERK